MADDRRRAARERRVPIPAGDGWPDRVACAAGPRASPTCPASVVTTEGEAALAIAQRLYPRRLESSGRELPDGRSGCSSGVPDVPCAWSRQLRSAGVAAQPNHVFFAHCGCGVLLRAPPRPRVGRCAPGCRVAPVYAVPVYASPVYASRCTRRPSTPRPVYASPVYASPGLRVTRVRQPRVRVAGVRQPEHRHRPPPQQRPPAVEPRAASPPRGRDRRPPRRPARVVVLDTGLATAGASTPPPLRLHAACTRAAARRRRPTSPTTTPTGDLDPAAGHGTFIAGLVEQVAPGAKVEVWRVLHAGGRRQRGGDRRRHRRPARPRRRPAALLNLSFGGYVMEEGGRAGRRGPRSAGPGLRRRRVGGQRRHLPAHRSRRRCPTWSSRGRRRARRPGAVQQLRPVGAGLRPRRGPGEHVLRRAGRRRASPTATATPTTSRAGRAGAARRSRRPSSPARWPRSWPPASSATEAVTRLVDNPAPAPHRRPGHGGQRPVTGAAQWAARCASSNAVKRSAACSGIQWPTPSRTSNR